MPNSPELEMLARLLYGENRVNITPEEAAGIVRTVFERRQLRGYPDTLAGVLTQPGQYQPLAPKATTASRANAATVSDFGPDNPRYNEFMTLAQHGWQEAQNPDPNAPTHYFSGEAPPWAKGMKLTKLGSHTFGREKRRKKPTQ